MRELGIFGALRRTLGRARLRPALARHVGVLLALTLPLGIAHAGSAPATFVSGHLQQVAAPGQALPDPLVLRNDATFPQDLRVFKNFDGTGGALFGGSLMQVDFPNVPAGGTVSTSLTLGPNAGSVGLQTCVVDGFGACVGGTSTFGSALTGTLERLTGEGPVDPGEAFTVEVEALNGTTTPMSAIPVEFTIMGPATGSPLSTTSNYMAPAVLNLTIDAAAPGGSMIVVTAERTDLTPRPPAQVFTFTVNEYELNQVSPPDGTPAQAGTTIPLEVEALYNGGPPNGENASRRIRWQIVQDPSGTSTLTGGGTETSTDIGFGDTRTSIDLTIGAPNLTAADVVVRAYAFEPMPARGAGAPPPNVRTVDFVIDAFDVLVVDASSGDAQTADVGDPVANPLVVNVTRNGTADIGATIDWSVSPANAVTFAGGASTAQSITDNVGNASISITRVNTDGPITITASHNQNPAASDTFTLTGTAAVLTYDTATGSGQSAATGEQFPQPLRLRVLRNGSPEAGAVINWSVSPAGAVTLDDPDLQTTTDANGFTQVIATAGSSGGPFTVTASRADSPATTFVFNGTVLDRRLDKPSTGSGDGQVGLPGQTLPQQLVAFATLNGAPESGVTINWSVPTNNATITSTTNPTDSGGLSRATIMLGATAGTVQVQAQRADAPGEVEIYTLTIVDKRLVKPTTGSGDGQTGVPGQPAAQPLVAVATLNGSPEGNVAVNWTVTGGDATITSTTSPTDNAGRSTAQILFGPTASTVTVRAQRVDVPSEIQTYTLTSTNTRTLEKPSVGSGDGQSGSISSTLPERLVVIARNNAIATPGVDVLWAVTSGNATLSANRTTTGGDGSTGVQVTFGNSPGTVTVRATRADDPNASSSFVLTAASITSPNLTLEKPEGSGDGTSAAVGTDVTLLARALIGTAPQADIEVLWELVSGSARLQGVRSFSDSTGRVSTVVTLGPSAGTVVVRAVRTDSGAAQTYTLTATGGVAATLEIVEGNNQSGAPGSAASPLRVRYSEGTRAIPNATIAWQVLSGSATLAAPTSTTNSDGIAQVGLTFGDTTGEVQVRASVGNASALFTLRVATPGQSLRLVSGNRQTGPLGTRADQALVVEVSDGLGTLLAGRTIQWRVVSGAATLDGTASTSDASGLATMGFRFGTTAGPIRLRAELPGLTPAVFVDFEATGFNPTLTIVGGNNQTAAPGATLPQDFVVQIGQPATKGLGGATVRWQVTAGGGTLAAATTTTDANGRASNRLTLGPSATTHTVTATVDGGATVTFTATSTVTAPAGTLTIIGGNNQTLTTRTNSAPMVVELKNTAGVAIRGASLLWTAQNAQLANVRTTTDDVGRASNVAQVLLPGDALVTVTIEGASAGASSVNFTLSAGVSNIPQLDGVEETIGGAVDNLCPALVALANPTPEQIDLRARCLELVANAGSNPQQVENALEQLREDVALAQANAALLTASTQFDNLKTRIAALRSGSRGVDLGGLALANSSGVMPLSFLPSAVVQAEDESEGGSEAEVGSDFGRWGFFASGIVGRGEQDGGRVTPEYDFDTSGITAGVDYRINEAWIVGASLGFNKQDTELANDGGGIDTDGWSVSGYTTWYRENNWYVDGVLTLGSNDYDMTRTISYDIVAAGGGLTSVSQVARASTGGDVVSAALSVGRDFNKGPWNFGPYLRATYTSVDFDGYEEELDGGLGSGLGLAIESRSLTSSTGVLGGKVTYAMSRDWGILMPHAQLEWEHEFRDDPQQVVTRFLHDPTGTRVRLEGDEVDANYFNIGIGLSALFPGGKSAFLYYEHLAGSEGQSQDNLSIGVRIEF